MGENAPVLARLHRLGVILAVVAFAATLAVALGAGSAAAALKVTVLGAAAPAAPSCPSECQAIGKTTGFQGTIGKTANPFVVSERGKIVAWSIKLSRPTDKQMDFFEDFFGGTPSARLSVLKPIQKQIKQGKPIYKLKSQTPVEELAGFLGTTTTFTLQSPLRVKPNQIVALSVPTWAPSFAVGLGGNTRWQASRKSGKCNATADIKAGSAHQAVGADRAYACVYKTARLLYSATMVADPNAAPPKKPPKKKK